MNVSLIEDEALAVFRLRKLLSPVAPAINVVQTTPSVDSSVAYLQTAPDLDLILMDIDLADGQSFAIFERTTVWAPVIFTTSYDEYAIKAFKVNSIDYLPKPIKQPELAASLEKIGATKPPFPSSIDSGRGHRCAGSAIASANPAHRLSASLSGSSSLPMVTH